MSPPGGVPAEGVVLQHGGETLRLRGFYPQAGEGGQAVQDTCHMLSLHTCHVSPDLAGICPRVQGSQELHQGPGVAGGGQQVQPEHHQPGGGEAPGQLYCYLHTIYCLLSTIYPHLGCGSLLTSSHSCCVWCWSLQAALQNPSQQRGHSWPASCRGTLDHGLHLHLHQHLGQVVTPAAGVRCSQLRRAQQQRPVLQNNLQQS